MVKLLECQIESEDLHIVVRRKEDLNAFAITLLCHMLEIFESDISTSEMTDLENFVNDWCRK